MVPYGSEATHEKDRLGFRASLGSVRRIAEKVGSPRDMVGTVQEGQRQSVNAMVDRWLCETRGIRGWCETPPKREIVRVRAPGCVDYLRGPHLCLLLISKMSDFPELKG